jgi:NitT/TauT family transport system substrate-binding protein
MVKYFRLVALLALTLSLGCTNTIVDPAPPRIYHVGMVQWAAFSPLNVADAKGFWKDQGLNVVVDNYAVNSDLNNNLDNGTIDFALDMIGSWVDLRLQGKPITVLGETDWSNGGDKIIIKDGMTPASLKGQKFAIYLKLLSVENFVAKYLAANGLAMSDFNIVQEDDPKVLADKFINSEYSITANYDPEAQRATDFGYGVVAATSRDYPGCIPEGFAVRTDRLANMPQDDLVKFFTGWIKAVQWSQDTANWAEYKAILNSKTYPGSNYSDADLRGFMTNVKVHNKADQLAANQTGGALYDYLTGLNTFAKQNGYPTANFTPADVFDNTAIVKALTK